MSVNEWSKTGVRQLQALNCRKAQSFYTPIHKDSVLNMIKQVSVMYNFNDESFHCFLSSLCGNSTSKY